MVLSFSLISCLILNNYFPEENFFLSTSRFWEILLGCVIFFYNKNFLLKGEKYLSLLLWLLLLFCLVYFDNKSNHPGVPNLIVVFITFSLTVFFIWKNIFWRINNCKNFFTTNIFNFFFSFNLLFL